MFDLIVHMGIKNLSYIDVLKAVSVKTSSFKSA